MAILSMPSSPKVQGCRFGLRENTQTFGESAARVLQTTPLVGARWAATYQLPPMFRTDAAPWCAFLAALNGRAGRFYGGDPSATVARGSIGGTPVVSGADQTGSSLDTAGWVEGNTLLKGDYFAYNTSTELRQLHKVAANATADALGEMTITFTPPIRLSPADTEPLILTGATCVMRLLSDEQAVWDLETARIYGIRFAAEETFFASA